MERNFFLCNYFVGRYLLFLWIQLTLMLYYILLRWYLNVVAKQLYIFLNNFMSCLVIRLRNYVSVRRVPNRRLVDGAYEWPGLSDLIKDIECMGVVGFEPTLYHSATDARNAKQIFSIKT